MIRRDCLAEDGSRRWVLISQVAHAHLAGCISEHWGAAPYAPLVEPADELVKAVYHHDDGWHQWEREPSPDPVTGRPPDFMVMPLLESLAIWRRSIDTAGQIGPLAGYAVSGHFSALLSRAVPAHESDDTWMRPATDFLDEQKQLRDRWLARWLQADPLRRNHELADRAVAILQFFDRLSLWLCCADRTETATFHVPGQLPLTCTPRGRREIVMNPWPLRVPKLQLKLHGRSIAVAKYADSAALASAASTPVLLGWLLVPNADL